MGINLFFFFKKKLTTFESLFPFNYQVSMIQPNFFAIVESVFEHKNKMGTNDKLTGNQSTLGRHFSVLSNCNRSSGSI